MKNLKTKKLYFQVYDELRNYIIRENLRPGDRLPTENELSEQLGVSRNVLREALKTLDIIGVVTSRPGIGMVVNSFGSDILANCLFLNLVGDGTDIVEQSQEVRKVLEFGFAQKCFDSITDEQINELENIVQKMESCEEQEIFALDTEFHSILYKNIGNDVLLAFVKSAWNYEREFRHLWISDTKVTYDKHVRILNALKNKDFTQYSAALNHHFTNFKTRKV